ncbi:IQ and AAA domain-containing protein 1-like [Crotalus adamanteus]|uniref:IQ and AAA domain-containing protein 1-like n=1 Tax=Crotalus adamanteus TaxID=8729 RepID=A0AAW1B1R9_CROAD
MRWHLGRPSSPPPPLARPSLPLPWNPSTLFLSPPPQAADERGTLRRRLFPGQAGPSRCTKPVSCWVCSPLLARATPGRARGERPVQPAGGGGSGEVWSGGDPPPRQPRPRKARVDSLPRKRGGGGLSPLRVRPSLWERGTMMVGEASTPTSQAPGPGRGSREDHGQQKRGGGGRLHWGRGVREDYCARNGDGGGLLRWGRGEGGGGPALGEGGGGGLLRWRRREGALGAPGKRLEGLLPPSRAAFPPPSRASVFPLRSTYGKLWLESRRILQELLEQELSAEPRKAEKSRAFFWHRLANLFLRYVQVARRLEACYDQVVHPQKRLVLRPLLESVLGRLLELKQELVQLDRSEYHYMDHVLEELKLTPAEMEVPIPRYFVKERAKVLQERQEVLAGLLARMVPTKAVPTPHSLTLRDEAVRLIQMAERMRQGRLRAHFMAEIRRDEERERRRVREGEAEPNRDLAAICIQKVWKGHAQRRLTRMARRAEMAFIGMVSAPSPGKGGTGRAVARAQDEARKTDRPAPRRSLRGALSADGSPEAADGSPAARCSSGCRSGPRSPPPLPLASV